jgi:hypothetical protein
MNTDSPALLERILRALPVSSQQRLLIMGWEEFPPPRDPARLLLRALGAPSPVHLVDLELETDRWFGQHIVTQGVIQPPSTPEGDPFLGRLSLSLALLPPEQLLLAQRLTERCRLTGVLLEAPAPNAASPPRTNVALRMHPRPYQPPALASLAVVSIASDRPH